MKFPYCVYIFKKIVKMIFFFQLAALNNLNFSSSTASYTKYLHSLLNEFYAGVIRLIDKSMKIVDTSVRGVMAAEIHKHSHYCIESAKKFLGREFQLHKVVSLQVCKEICKIVFVNCNNTQKKNP